jgi:hypothetical protein
VQYLEIEKRTIKAAGIDGIPAEFVKVDLNVICWP